jgi:F-type H+-transporting ATPase subunit delta
MPNENHTSPIATAYARSLLDLANGQNQAKEIGQELNDLAKVIDSDPSFQTFLSNPAIGHADREQLIIKVFQGRVAPLLMNFLLVANRRARLGLLGEMAVAYSDLLDQQFGIIEVDATVSQRLSPDEFEQVRQRIAQTLKREVVLHQYIDESIIGGLVLRIGDRLLDASVKAQLRAIRRQLLTRRNK